MSSCRSPTSSLPSFLSIVNRRKEREMDDFQLPPFPARYPGTQLHHLPPPPPSSTAASSSSAAVPSAPQPPQPPTTTQPIMPHPHPHAHAHPHPSSPTSLFRDGTAPVFRACASAMQRPTLSNVRIRSTRDAAHIFLAVAQNRLPMTVRRLDAEERRAIVSGNVYVWEERGANSEATGLGIERW